MKTESIRDILEQRKFLFFGGKGGVGKTTMAATAATWLSDHGYKTLIVATDPTVSLSAIYEQDISATEITKIGTERNLCGLNINPKKAMGMFQTRLEGTLSGISSVFGSELLSTPCTEEIAAFDQFVSFFEDTEHDKVVFDTAPTGHTLRELSMPFDWSGYISNQIKNRRELSEVLGFVYDEKMVADLNVEKERYDKSVKGLSDKRISAFNLVLLPEKLPIEETARAVEDLGNWGIEVPSLIINEVIPKEVLKGNWFLERRSATQDKYLAEIDRRFPNLIKKQVPLFETDIYGLDRIRKVGEVLYGK
ncbi:MAG: putative arsenical pump-driving ATPase [Methanomassiliicoccales archaeon PtaU1.Bin124]|nr:MAG: putative arsenical pump-driving ATPase [Methanomassiliicoccales archaeon PtaU1.Bin124]